MIDIDRYCAFLNDDGRLQVLPCNVVGAHNVAALMSGGTCIKPICHADTEDEALEQAQAILDSISEDMAPVCQQ